MDLNSSWNHVSDPLFMLGGGIVQDFVPANNNNHIENGTSEGQIAKLQSQEENSQLDNFVFGKTAREQVILPTQEQM